MHFPPISPAWSVRFLFVLLASACLSLSGLPDSSFAAPGEIDYTNHAPWHTQPPVGVPFTVYGVDNAPDLHGDPINASLVLFVAGNQFMVMPDLIAAFKRRHPEIRHIFYETLPPGILARQIVAKGLTIGNLHLRIQPDIYESGKVRMESMVKKRLVLASTVVAYAKNKLAIMVYRGNPKAVRTLADLGKPGIRLSLPNPEWEGIGKQIRHSLELAGGPALVDRIFRTKRADGTTTLTHIHHRETAVRILDRRSDAGITWISEILFQKSLGHPVSLVGIPDRENTRATYVAAQVRGARHRQAAKDWLTFLSTKTAARIYTRDGFSVPSR